MPNDKISRINKSYLKTTLGENLECVPVRGLVLRTLAPPQGSVFCSQHQCVPGSLCPDPEVKNDKVYVACSLPICFLFKFKN